jgi:hypothetical protein
MRDDEVSRLRGGHRPRLDRSLHGDLVAPEDQQIEVELPRTPTLALLPPERPLDALQRDEQGEGPCRRIRARRHVERGDGVPELGLVRNTDRGGGIEARDAAEPGPRQRGEGVDACRDRLRGIPEVRAQADVRSAVAGQRGPSDR